MREVYPTRQVPGEPHRRWFSSAEVDLIVWCDAAGAPVSFQICFDKGRREHALTWEPSTGLGHSAVDDGEAAPGLRYKATPVLVPDDPRELDVLRERFIAASAQLPGEIVAFVCERLRD